MEKKIIDYINKVAADKGIVVDETTNLYDSGIMDSMEIILFLSYLDEKLNIKIYLSDLDFENFKSLQSIQVWFHKIALIER